MTLRDPFPIIENPNSILEAEFRAIGKFVEFKKGTIILEAGAVVQGIYYLLEGKVDCYRISMDGRKKTTLIAGPGSILSDVPLFDGDVQPCNYLSLEKIVAIFVDKPTLKKAVLFNPDIKDLMIISISKKFRSMGSQIAQMCFDDAGQRVAKILVNFASYYGKPMGSDQAILIDSVLTQQFISDLAGINRTTTSRIISMLKSENIIDIDNRTYIIKDLARLEDWSMSQFNS